MQAQLLFRALRAFHKERVEKIPLTHPLIILIIKFLRKTLTQFYWNSLIFEFRLK